MATASEVKSMLDEIANIIRERRAVITAAVESATAVSAFLASLPTTYADVIDTINLYGTTDAFEALSKAELAKLVAEYNALKADADTIAAVNLAD